MTNWEKTLESMIGVKGVESLTKAIHRRDSDSTIGPLDVYLPLLVVPRTIISWLVQNIKPLEVKEELDLEFPSMEDITIKVRKTGRDSYDGEFIKDGKIIHSFEKQTLPNVGGNLMSVGELYEGEDSETVGHVHDLPIGGHTEGPESAEEAEKEDEISPDMTMPLAIMQMIGPKPTEASIGELNSKTLNNLTMSIGKLIDALVSNKMTESKLHDAIHNVKDKDPEKEVLEKEKTEQEVQDYNESEVLPKEEMVKTFNKEQASGKAAPTRPDGKVEPIPRNDMQRSNQSYFRDRLNRSKGIEKTEKKVKIKEYHISELEMYNTCPHCAVPEFEKTESGPKYKPCACFYITLKHEDDRKASFVKVIKKKEGGYSLNFSKNADKEIVSLFLSTLKNTLLKYKDSLS